MPALAGPELDERDWADVRQAYLDRSSPPSSCPARQATGPIDRADADAALRWFVPPAPFERAAAVLKDRRMVVLVGDDGCGRRTGALALLRRLAGRQARLVALSPALTFGQLAVSGRFEPGAGYLLADLLGGGEAIAAREFETARLSDRLRAAGAYLVVTATPSVVPRRTLPRLVVPWRPPDPVRLFDRGVRDLERAAGPDHDCGPDPQRLATARLRSVLLRGPREVTGLVRGLADQGDPVRPGPGPVAAWFDAGPPRADVLTAAALVFLHGLPARSFDAHLTRLLELAGERAAPGHVRLAVRGQAVEFGAPGYRDLVVVELYARFGEELWEPLRRWLHEVAVAAAPEVRVELAHGLALLARTAFAEVADVIDRWADSETSAARLTAAITLWWMCADDPLLPAALRTAMRWVHHRGQHRAMTAAVALGGDLGLRYRCDALRWLWFLARRTERIGLVARQSIGHLFAAAVPDQDGCRAMLVLAARELRETLTASIAGPDDRAVRAMRHAVLAMLTVAGPGTDSPAVVKVVTAQPDNVAPLGALWAAVLVSAPHRKAALDALVRALAPIDAGHQAAVRTFGAAIVANLPDLHRQVLRRDLTGPAGDPARHLVPALLDAHVRSTEAAAEGRTKATVGRGSS